MTGVDGVPTTAEVEARWIGGGRSGQYLRSRFRAWLAARDREVVEAHERANATSVVVGTGAGGEGDPAPAEATPGVTRSTDCPEAPAQAHHRGAPCVMMHTPPFDFGVCETHDTTFALGERCKFDGRDPADVYAEEVDEQRARAVLAEMALAQHQEAVLVADEEAAVIMAEHAYNRASYECQCMANDDVPTIDETEWARHVLLVLASNGLVLGRARAAEQAKIDPLTQQLAQARTELAATNEKEPR